MLKIEQDILQVIEQDTEMMAVIKTTMKLGLPDSWVSAGFVRSKIWDVQHGFVEPFSLPDVDVIYFEPTDTREETEKVHEAKLHEWMPGVPWSVKNQARMHTVNDLEPFTSATDGMAHFPETVTALGVKLSESGELVLSAPWGVQDVLDMVVRPTPYYRESERLRQIFRERMQKKDWPSVWPHVRMEEGFE